MSDTADETRRFQITPDGITAADLWIEEVGRSWGIAERLAFGARVCVAEIAANVLEHGSRPGQPASLEITLHRREVGLDLDIADSGMPFDPTTAPERPLAQTIEAAQIGGLGLRLIRSYASKITYLRDGSYNRIRLHLLAA